MHLPTATIRNQVMLPLRFALVGGVDQPGVATRGVSWRRYHCDV